jgi:metal-responsive CopG/Arc/MetJ family transcriptional regulator
MANIKTAISIQDSLFKQADALAREMHISRSRLFGMAVEDFIQRQENQQLLEKINRAYENEPNPAEEDRLNKMRRQHRQIVDGEW